MQLRVAGDVAARCDILMSTRAQRRHQGIVNASVLDRLKLASHFVNTARGEVVDHAALEQRCASAASASASTCSPPSVRRDRASAIRCGAAERIYTHHIGVVDRSSADAIAADGPHHRVLQGHRKVPNVVNLARRTPATHMLVVRHRDRPGARARSTTCATATSTCRRPRT
jgi:D-3-phosphoglycerate dehydrogenase